MVKKFIFKLVALLTFCSLTAIITLSLLTYSPTDRSILFDTSENIGISNWLGTLGANIAAFLIYFLGHSAFLLIPILFLLLADTLGYLEIKKNKDKLIALFCLVIDISLIEHYYNLSYFKNLYPGGLIGGQGCRFLYFLFEPLGTGIFLSVFTLALLIIIDNFWVFRFIGHLVVRFIFYLLTFTRTFLLTKFYNFRATKYFFNFVSGPALDILPANFLGLKKNGEDKSEDDLITKEIKQIFNDPFWSTEYLENLENNQINLEQINLEQEIILSNINQIQNVQESKFTSKKIKAYKLPNLLTKNSSANEGKVYKNHKNKEKANLLEQKLSKFGISGKIVSITSGPVVTLFEYAPDPETKISTILAREDDLALALEALSLRIIAPIPGKSVVGFEVAHQTPEPVLFYDLYNQSKDKAKDLSLPLLLGTDTQGAPVLADLTKLPHLLLAGATGSGKSVAVQNMIMTLLCSKTPELVKLILIDPKRLELSVYQDIGHLLFPVITEAKQALVVLNWALKIMEERYAVLASVGVKNCLEYHALSEQNSYEMPFIVIVIDELADLMMTAGKDLEVALVRLAQMSRASGIHMIAATQRPSVDVVTGLIKVNFPSRLACKVASKVDSRTILDSGGAEKLLGRGDMLFLNNNGTLQRLHGAYVSSEEIEEIANSIREQTESDYQDLDFLQNSSLNLADPASNLEQDDLFDKAVEFIKTKQEVSISLIQRVFRIGYNRSARLIDQLEAKGHIMAPTGSKMRKVKHEQK